MRNIIIGVLCVFVIIFLFKNCNHSEPKLEEVMTKNEIAKQKEIALNYKFKVQILEIENKKLILKSDSLKSVAELSKNNYQQLKHQRPKYIKNVIDCNDTIQAVYNFLIKKDSVCNTAINNLDNVISVQDSTIKVQNNQKELLINSVAINENLLLNAEKNNFNLNENLKQEKKIKNTWKFSAIGMITIDLIRIILSAK